jgi:hypothetical protein
VVRTVLTSERASRGIGVDPRHDTDDTGWRSLSEGVIRGRQRGADVPKQKSPTCVRFRARPRQSAADVAKQRGEETPAERPRHQSDRWTDGLACCDVAQGCASGVAAPDGTTCAFEASKFLFL